MNSSDPIDVFIGYAQADTRFLEQLRKQLTAVERVGLVDAWHDGEIEVGSNREEAIHKAMSESEIIILLISADYIASEFKYEKEMKWAMEFHEQKKATLLPVILKDCAWKYAPFAGLKVLPRGGIPVTDEHWKSTDRALMQVVEEVIRTSNKLRGLPVEEESAQDTDSSAHTDAPAPASLFNLKNGLIALLVLMVLFFFGNQFFDESDSGKTEADISQTLNNPSLNLNEENKDAETANTPKESEKKAQNPVLPPVEKQASKNTPIAKQESGTDPQREAQPAENYGNQGKRLNVPPPEDKKEDLEILPEPEPPAAEPKQYTINGQLMTDQRDKKSYRLTKINGIWWMAENLNTNIHDAFCPENCAKVGRLYDFKLAQKICPKGWRLPTKAEWKALSSSQIAELKLSSTLSGTKYRQQYLQAGQKGYYWSSDFAGGDEAWAFEISGSGNHAVDRRYSFQGMHCRCILAE